MEWIAPTFNTSIAGWSGWLCFDSFLAYRTLGTQAMFICTNCHSKLLITGSSAACGLFVHCFSGTATSHHSRP